MSPVLELEELDLAAAEEIHDERSSSRSLVRLLAVAATVLLISFLVVNRSTDALSGRAGAGAHFRAGNVSLVDDDTDRSLFDVPVMAPGQQYENCIAVSYAGALERPAVELAGRGTGALASALQLTVEVGRDGRFGDCAEFVADDVLYEGRLDAFTSVTAFTPDGPGDERAFRFRFVLTGDAPQGAEAGVDFDWSVESR